MKKSIALLLISTSLSACGFEIVDTGHRGVEITLGKAGEESLEEGLYFYNPFTSDVIEMDVRTQRKDIETFVYTKDVQQAQVKGVVNYNLEKVKLIPFIRKLAKNGIWCLLTKWSRLQLKMS